ncbi:PREDICTED: uncharacterized protein LOC104772502 [Camelina sativa]|uniref:Uncharacterized protein LOC104772502 n=1 Tax=Camelina sativa TaxID=90675 RepID=A0ABM1REH6_CAMSA|nr:PREDICTED: uncharacterized protein LOC104772502 [Camelina sativa]
MSEQEAQSRAPSGEHTTIPQPRGRLRTRATARKRVIYPIQVHLRNTVLCDLCGATGHLTIHGWRTMPVTPPNHVRHSAGQTTDWPGRIVTLRRTARDRAEVPPTIRFPSRATGSRLSATYIPYWLDYIDHSAPPKEILRTFLLNNLSLTHPLEENHVLKFFLNILELLPRCYSHFEVDEVEKTICFRCKMNMAYSGQRSYGIIVNADSLRVYNSVFVIRAFETTLKIIRLNVKMLCDKEGCGKRNYVQWMINNLPTVLTIALQWENNETSIDIYRTAAALETEICISAICRYEGDSLYTKYRLVSMACSHGDQYNCIAYENSSWVRYFGSEKEVIGDWKSVVDIFLTHDIRPEILFFESVLKLLRLHTC